MVKNPKIRLSDHDIEALKSLFRQYFLEGDQLWLFGSRTDPLKKGGDIDLYIETKEETIEKALKMKSDFLWDLEKKIGEQKIDVVLHMVKFPYPLPIHDIARTEGIRLI